MKIAETGGRKARRMLVPKQAALQSSRVKIKARQKGFGFNVPPEPEFVSIYFDQQGQPDEAERFYRYYQKEQWKTITGTKIRNWKVLAADWIFERRQAQKWTLRR
jgi:hypothetical protein